VARPRHLRGRTPLHRQLHCVPLHQRERRRQRRAYRPRALPHRPRRRPDLCLHLPARRQRGLGGAHLRHQLALPRRHPQAGRRPRLRDHERLHGAPHGDRQRRPHPAALRLRRSLDHRPRCQRAARPRRRHAHRQRGLSPGHLCELSRRRLGPGQILRPLLHAHLHHHERGWPGPLQHLQLLGADRRGRGRGPRLRAQELLQPPRPRHRRRGALRRGHDHHQRPQREREADPLRPVDPPDQRGRRRARHRQRPRERLRPGPRHAALLHRRWRERHGHLRREPLQRPDHAPARGLAQL
jgi:hypothetical protein